MYLGGKKRIFGVLEKKPYVSNTAFALKKYTYAKSAQTRTHAIQSINNLMRLQENMTAPLSSFQPHPTGMAEQST